MITKIFKKFLEKRKDLREEFPRDDLNPLDGNNKYPFATSLQDKGIYAWQLLFFTNVDNASIAFDLMNEVFKSDIDGVSGEFFLEGEDGKAHLYISDKFGGKIISIITNNVDVISGLQSLGITPGSPWICFPEIDPDGLGSRQGNFEYWWDNFWLPFWDSLDTNEKQNYLHMNKAPTGWVEYLDFYEEHLRH